MSSKLHGTIRYDKIVEIGIDNSSRLYIIPYTEQFTMIWRSAAEVHWDIDRNCLYSPKPREWSYCQWYHHIVDLVKDEYSCELFITEDTKWINISGRLINEIQSTLIKPTDK
jgi:hypothetical protein